MMHRIKTIVDRYHDMLCIELDSESETHLFRHASEITKETKGGYLKGKIVIPSDNRPCYLRLSLVPAEPDPTSNVFNLHPNLLHVNLRQNKKNRKLEAGELPDDVDWSFVFRIDPDGSVSRVSSTSPQRRFSQMLPMQTENLVIIQEDDNNTTKHQKTSKYERDMTLGPLRVPEYSNLALQRVTVVKDKRYIDLGPTGLMLNIITPLQKFSKGGTTLSDVLQQRYRDLFQRPMPDGMLKKVEESFVTKKDKVKLQRVRLSAEIFGCDPTMAFQKSSLSQIIINSKSKECGPLQLHDVNPVASCHQSKTKIFILSFFKLVSEVKAAFVLWDKENDCIINDPIAENLNQPEDCTVFNQTVVICYAPPQDWNVLQAIKAKNFEIRICAYRPSDNRMSMNSFKYEYLPHVIVPPSYIANEHGSDHGPSGFVCGSCHLQQINSVRVVLPLAKPGWQRRKHDEKKEIPDQVKTHKNSWEVVAGLTEENNVIMAAHEPEQEVMDLSIAGIKRKQCIISNSRSKEAVLIPPKKRKFAPQQNFFEPNIHKHVIRRTSSVDL